MKKHPIKEYLEITGQTLQELMSGSMQYGPTYIDKLVKQALEEKKKIVFIGELTEGEDLGLGRYELLDL